MSSVVSFFLVLLFTPFLVRLCDLKNYATVIFSNRMKNLYLILLRPLLASACLCFAKYPLHSSEAADVSKSGAISKPPVILIGIDGLRWDVLDRIDAPNLKRIVESGIHSAGLIPQFPSHSFVNLYTIVTGLYP